MHRANFCKYYSVPSCKAIFTWCRGWSLPFRWESRYYTLTADSSLTRPFLRHFGKCLQKLDVKNVKITSYDIISMIFLTNKTEVPWEREILRQNRREFNYWYQVRPSRQFGAGVMASQFFWRAKAQNTRKCIQNEYNHGKTWTKPERKRGFSLWGRRRTSESVGPFNDGAFFMLVCWV